MHSAVLTVDPLTPTADPDYKLKCIGYWRENLQSYLITYDELDPYSKYRCWVSADVHTGDENTAA